MTGSEKIIEKINSDGKAQCDAVADAAAKQADRILADGKARADGIAKAEDELTQKAVDGVIRAAKSRAELDTRNSALAHRRKLINQTLDAVKAAILQLPDGEYFELLYALAKKTGGASGEIRLNARDLKRLPADFSDRMKKCGVDAKLCGEPCDIDGGFIVGGGEIEHRVTVADMIDDDRDALEDIVNRVLFEQ